jgi:membrane-bound serine protease (ClpP class)
MSVTKWIRIAPAALLALFIAQPASAQGKKETDGVFITVQNPINNGQISRIKAEVDGARNAVNRSVKIVVFDFNPEGKEAATESFGDCYELAKYIRNTLQANGVMTVAFVHGKTTRHTVLPAIACDQLVMSSSGQIGEVWSKERPVDQNEQGIYHEVAGINRAGPVMKMIDKDVKLVPARFKGGSPIYVDVRRLDRKEGPYAEVQRAGNQLPMAPGVELYNVEQAQKFNLCQRQLESREEIKDFFQLSAGSISGDPLAGKTMKPVRIVIEGVINTALREKLRRQIESATKAREENTFFFVIETTTGGDPKAARDIADDIIALGTDQNFRARTIAFIPGKAPDLAIFLAFACQEIVMYKGPAPEGEAVIGDFDTMLGGANGRKVNVEAIRQNLQEVAEKTGYSKLVVDGLFDKNMVIVRARNKETAESMLMTKAERDALAAKGWVQEGVVKDGGVLLKLTASKAKDLRIAKTIDNKDIAEVYALYGVEAKDVRSSEPSWLDDFASFLRQTHVSILLVIIGIAGLVLELKAPGLIVPGVVAAICFVLFFWAQTQLGGQLIYLAIMLFLLGLALLGIEIFLLPGFGVAGVSGILLILAGLVLAGIDKAPESTEDWMSLIGKMLRYGLTMAGAVVLAFILSRYLPKIPYANRLMLIPPEDKLETDETSPLPGVDLAVALLGQVGTATSMLRPAGMAKFGDRYVDVVTEGDFIPPGTPIQVVEVEGTRVVVKRV